MGVLVLAALGVALGEAVYDVGRPGVLHEALGLASASVTSESGAFGGDGAFGPLGKVLTVVDEDSAMSRAAPRVPPGFEEEVLDLDAFANVRVDEASSIVGFSVPGAIDEARALLARELEGRGWLRAGNRTGAVTGFVKAEGRYRWLSIAWVGFSDATEVVIQYRKEEA